MLRRLDLNSPVVVKSDRLPPPARHEIGGALRPRSYTPVNFAEFERLAILAGSWICIGREAQLSDEV